MEITLETLHDDMQGLSSKVQNLGGGLRDIDASLQSIRKEIRDIQDMLDEMKRNLPRFMIGLFISGGVLLFAIVGSYLWALKLAMEG